MGKSNIGDAVLNTRIGLIADTQLLSDLELAQAAQLRYSSNVKV